MCETSQPVVFSFLPEWAARRNGFDRPVKLVIGIDDSHVSA
jgi:hypothetical protein